MCPSSEDGGGLVRPAASSCWDRAHAPASVSDQFARRMHIPTLPLTTRKLSFSALPNCLSCKGSATQLVLGGLEKGDGVYFLVTQWAAFKPPPPHDFSGREGLEWRCGVGVGEWQKAVSLGVGPGVRPTTVIPGLWLKAHQQEAFITSEVVLAL